MFIRVDISPITAGLPSVVVELYYYELQDLLVDVAQADMHEGLDNPHGYKGSAIEKRRRNTLSMLRVAMDFVNGRHA